MKHDIYQEVTDKIIADLEQGELTWLKPWSAGNMDGRIIKPLRHNGMAYSGINVLMLWGAAMEGGYLSPFWMTYRQAKEYGAHVRKGERGNLVVYANTITKTEEQDDGSQEDRKIPFMKGYSVFNVEQIEGLPEHYLCTKPEPIIDPAQRIEHVDQFFSKPQRQTFAMAEIRPTTAVGRIMCRCRILRASAAPRPTMPRLAHELIHWTKHKSRLDRDFGRKTWGDEGYAREELVAELGAAFLCADLALTPEPGTDHAAYIQSWLKVLKDDKRAIFSAAANAQRAADFLHGFQTEERKARAAA